MCVESSVVCHSRLCGFSHLPPSYLLNVSPDAVSINEGISRRDALIACQHLESRGLSCSIEAQQAETLPFSYSERQPVHSQETLPAAVHL